MTTPQVLYTILVFLGLADIALVTPALRASRAVQTSGRLVSTLLVLSGLVVASSVRIAQRPQLNATLTAALLLIDVGLAGYTITLPERGLLEVLRRHRGTREDLRSDQ